MKGCKNCPAYAKCTVTYRGSACAALRSTYGIDTDPEIITNADRIRAMDDEQLAKLFYSVYKRSCIDFVNQSGINAEIEFKNSEASEAAFLKYLQQPAKEDTDG